MKKRNDDFNLSGEEVVSEFMKAYSSDSRHHHHHHSSQHHSSENKTDSIHHSHHHNNDNKHRPHSVDEKKKSSVLFRVLVIIVIVLFVLALLGVGAVLVLRHQGKNDINKKKDDVVIDTVENAIAYDDSGKTVEYKGQKYTYNENIVTAAFLGIDDKSVSVNISDEHGVAGQADTIMVLAYDTVTGDVSIITVPRDTIADVDIYSASGKFARTEEMQICLSFAYGDGGESSCENVIKSLERVLLGVPIDSYFSLRVRGVDALNAAVGGIELTSLETIGQFVEGEKVHLQGTDARFYVTRRDRSKIDSDTYRRKRQIQYVKAFASKTMSLAKEDIGIVTTLYNTAKQYSVTDVSLSSAVYLAGELITKSAKINKVASLAGEYVNTDSFPEYRLNKELVYETILEIFYNKV